VSTRHGDQVVRLNELRQVVHHKGFLGSGAHEADATGVGHEHSLHRLATRTLDCHEHIDPKDLDDLAAQLFTHFLVILVRLG
jgi:hypothetical protein